MRRFVRPGRLRRSRRLAGRKRILYILMVDLTWRGRGRIWAIMEMVEPARKVLIAWNGNSGASSQSQDSLPWIAENPGCFSTRKAIKNYSRDTFFPFQCLRETSSSMAFVSPAVPLHCPKMEIGNAPREETIKRTRSPSPC
jgi:hypothetical protein